MLPAEEMRRPALDFASKDFPSIDVSLTIGGALDFVRAKGLRDKIIYLYVTDADGVLKGVLPTRRLLTETLEKPVADCMIPRVVAIPVKATLLEACEFFVLHKFLAFPVVDEKRRILGVIDVNVFTDEVLDLAERKQTEDVFQSLGFRASEAADASAARAFRLRFPWLLATIAGGTLCALLSGAFAETLEQQLLLAFFLTLVLGLGESVAAQSLAVTLQAMHHSTPTFVWLLRAVKKEFTTAMLLGGSCGLLVGFVVFTWHRDALAAGSIAASIFLSMTTACLLGVLIPSISRALRLDPKIAAGPLTLALADICTLLAYFGLASLALKFLS
jgi:magnesium transporter